MQKILMTGGTGSGKTYEAIHQAKELGQTLYLAPCRQLVYETAIKYGNAGDSVSTGEVKIDGDKRGDMYAVFESQRETDNDYDTLIVDEAHFLTDAERGECLRNRIKAFQGNVFLVTATQSFYCPYRYKKVILKPKMRFKKKKISFDQFLEREEKGVPSILFHKYKDDCGEYGGAVMTAETPADERLETQLKFARGELTFVECTNVLAQGLNFPCENLAVLFNEWDGPEIVQQKLGRLGRYGITSQDTLLTYSGMILDKVRKQKLSEVRFSDRLYDNRYDWNVLRHLTNSCQRFSDAQVEVLRQELSRWHGKPEHICPEFSFYGDDNGSIRIYVRTKYADPYLSGVVQRLTPTCTIDNISYIQSRIEEHNKMKDRVAAIIQREWASKSA
jgi:superfamily II DNA or RNA helicase